MKVGRASDCCKRLDANAFAFKKLLEKIQYFFLRPKAEVNGVALIHPARRGREFWMVSSKSACFGNRAFCIISFPCENEVRSCRPF